MLLNVLICERSKVLEVGDPTFFASNRTDKECARSADDLSFILLNELTWPELARRYILTCQYIDSNLESNDITNCKGERHVRCLCGDGGVLCGSVSRETLKETYALILEKAMKDVSGCTMEKGYVLPFEYSNKILSRISFEASTVDCSNLPEWAQQLIPVKKLRTNVGSRIRKCINDALDLDPPHWARKILKGSISKEVYKANAAGPTKRTVLSVLSELELANNGQPNEENGKGRKENITKTVTDSIMEKCRSVLHYVISGNNVKALCSKLSSSFYRDDNALESPPTACRPLDFDAIDLKLSNGDYSGSHKAFLEDVREVWNKIRVVCKDEPESVQLAGNLCKHFEVLYEEEVLSLVKKSPEASEGVCKACGIDKDDEKVLLCDTCDSEYHTYCLKPPLPNIPKGNWYCPSCALVRGQSEVAFAHLPTVKVLKRIRYQEKEILILLEKLKQFASSMEDRDYWEFRLEERILLMRFLCDEFLDSSLIHEHLEQCVHVSSPALRRDFLGRDSSGRLYWIFGSVDTHLQLVVDNTLSVQNDMQGSWVFYKSKAEIEGVVSCLRANDSTEEELKQAIMQLLRLIDELSQQDRNLFPQPQDPKPNLSNLSESGKILTPSCITKAFSVLDAQYGPYIEADFTITLKSSGGERRLFRCECLEPIWPCRHHCFACHHTFSTIEDLEGHIKGCISSPTCNLRKCSIIELMVTEDSCKEEIKSSCKPLSGKTINILRLFKIDLLDMEAAVPEEALINSKLKVDRCVWRTFVKSARTLYEMIQASIVLENMISPKYFKSRCWYWSSLIGSAKSSNISSLALCIYSLDAAIIYRKTATSTTDLEDTVGVYLFFCFRY
ncbi:hypothetical protein ACHQM5_008383 [Ranunculus cassubicifolius]